MKRVVAFLGCLVMFFFCFVSVNATEIAEESESILISKTVEYLEDGTKIEIAVYEDPVATYASDYMKSGKKVYVATNYSGDVLYKFTVTGVFSIDEGVSATCTSASYSTDIINTNWSCKTATATASRNRAIANGTFIRKQLGITVETDNVQVTLTCDDLGNLS